MMNTLLLLLSLFLMTNHFVIAHDSKRIVKIVYQPYGPLMCREVCKDSIDSHIFKKEDLSCSRMPGHDSKHVAHYSVDDYFICLKGNIMTSTSFRPRHHQSCDSFTEGPETLKELPNLTEGSHHNNTRDLHKACKEGNLCLVKIIVSKRLADINCRDETGKTPVMTAVHFGQSAVFDFLVHIGCDLAARDNSHTNVLHIACGGCNPDIVRELIVTHKYDVDSRGWHRWTPVMYASCYGRTKMVDLLLRKGCNPALFDNTNQNILHIACHFGQVNTVKYILNHNIVNIDGRGLSDSKGYFGSTPVMTAARWGKREVVELLVSRNCNMTATDDEKNNILHVACIGGNLSTLVYILKLDVLDIDIRGQYNRTPVMFAAIMGHGMIVDLLVSKNCNLMVPDVSGYNVLHLACFYGRTNVVKTILDQNLLDVNSRGQYDRTPVMLAVNRGHHKVVALLFSRNCDLEVVDLLGNNILHMACEGGEMDMVQQILKLGIARLKDKNKSGLTPGKLAEKKGYRNIVSLLKAEKYW